MNATGGKANWRRVGFVVVVVLVAAGLLYVGAVRLSGRPVLGAQKVALNIASDSAPVSLGEFKNGFASVIEPDLPAVVNIASTTIVKQPAISPDLFNNPMFRQFFGDQFGPPSSGPQTRREHSLGSGVIVNSDGYILTNNHVVSGASDVEVFTQNRMKFKAKVIGTDPRTDVAVLKIDSSDLPVLTLGDSSKLKVGDLVFAIGDPFGIGETATTGIVSATGRALGGAIERYEDFIQTDAAINPGNSGGALIDLHGHLIGINTAIISGGGGNQGVGFAIPINMARNVMDQLVEHGKVIRGYLGVTIQPVDADMAKAFGLSQGGGALVGDISPDSPAAKAGIQRGDIILDLNGQMVNGPDDLSVHVSELAPGTVAHLKIFRNGQTREIDVTLGEFAEKAEAAAAGGEAPTTLNGLQVQNLTPDVAKKLGLPSSSTGVVITSVDPSGAAAAAGLRPGDVIQEVNRKEVHNINEYRLAIAASGKQPVLLLVSRGGTTLFVVVQPQ